MKITKAQVENWNAKLSNGFKLDVRYCMIWNEKIAVKQVPLPDDRFIKAEIGYYEVYTRQEAAPWRMEVMGVRPRLTLTVWEPTGTPGMWASHGMGTTVEITDQVYPKRLWNELAKYTADWTEERILAEAKKHMAELQNPCVA